MTKFSSPSVKRLVPSEAKSAAVQNAPPSPAAAGTLSGRSVPEWRGKTPDTKIPPHVRARIFETHGGVCHLSKRRIRAGDAWECDHIIALCNGGEHRESNLAPALSEPHRIKTKADVREKSKIARLRKKHLGIKPDRTIRAWRKFDGTVVYAPRER